MLLLGLGPQVEKDETRKRGHIKILAAARLPPEHHFSLEYEVEDGEGKMAGR